MVFGETDGEMVGLTEAQKTHGSNASTHGTNEENEAGITFPYLSDDLKNLGIQL